MFICSPLAAPSTRCPLLCHDVGCELEIGFDNGVLGAHARPADMTYCCDCTHRRSDLRADARQTKGYTH